jgi:hypothetical protein|tara:strand:+ start:1228 stop:1404 length:177 start_codon:yes stop_codon:yes gene_type:complete
MDKKNIVNPNRQQLPRVNDIDDEITQGKREANLEYAPHFNEYNWLKAVSPNLVVKIKE